MLERWIIPAAVVGLLALLLSHPARSEGVVESARCAALLTYLEARDRNMEAQRGVAHVVYNRAAALRKTPCWLLDHPSWNGEAFRKMAHRAVPREPAAWETAQFVALDALTHPQQDPTGGATHFHDASVTPDWRDLQRTVVIDGLTFYRRKQ